MLRMTRSTGAATPEQSTYPALANLLNAVGATLRPKVFCVVELTNQGAGHPDIGLYAASQVQRGRPRAGQTPERGVIEVKGPSDDAWLTAESAQVSGYWDKYRLVLVTNTRDFVLLGEDADGNPAKLETFKLADSEDEFSALIQRPRAQGTGQAAQARRGRPLHAHRPAYCGHSAAGGGEADLRAKDLGGARSLRLHDPTSQGRLGTSRDPR